MAIFDSKYFNCEVFGKYVDTIPRVKQNAFLSSGAIVDDSSLATLLRDQTGGNYITVPMVGRIDGNPDNYDGSTDINDSGIATYAQSMIVVGRAKGFGEKDFSYDITGGVDFMAEIAKQVALFWDDVDQDTILAELEGVFAMSGAFPANHTLDISGDTENKVDATTLNNAMQKAAGANKNIFALAIMHSQVATNLENMQVLQYFKGTDSNGIQRDLALASWNGRAVLIDDDVPIQTVSGGTKYTTYILGRGAIKRVKCGVKVPYEMWRDPKTNGGEDKLYTRQRNVFAPFGISFKMPSTPIISPTNAQLKDGSNWELVKDTTGGKTINHKAIPIARIISMG